VRIRFSDDPIILHRPPPQSQPFLEFRGFGLSGGELLLEGFVLGEQELNRFARIATPDIAIQRQPVGNLTALL
jgi:hypothetical protein